MTRSQKPSKYAAQFDVMVSNIKSTFYHGMQYKHVAEAGMCWYKDAHAYAVSLAHEFKVSVECAAEVIAALSPSNRWERNIVDARLCFEAVRDSEDTANEVALSFKTGTYMLNKIKAVRIARGERGVLGGLKVQAFAECINNPATRQTVCVDGHARNIAMNERLVLKNSPRLTPKDYNCIASAYIQAAKEINEEMQHHLPVSPAQVQAVTWTTWRIIHGIDKAGAVEE